LDSEYGCTASVFESRGADQLSLGLAHDQDGSLSLAGCIRARLGYLERISGGSILGINGISADGAHREQANDVNAGDGKNFLRPTDVSNAAHRYASAP